MEKYSLPPVPRYDDFIGIPCNKCGKPIFRREKYDYRPARNHFGVILTGMDGKIKYNEKLSYMLTICHCFKIIQYRDGRRSIGEPTDFDSKKKLAEEYEACLKAANPMKKFNVSKHSRHILGLE